MRFGRVGPAVIALAVLGSCVSPVDTGAREGIRVGVLIPFTGDLAGSGSTIEQAIIMAAERINNGGGIAGQPIVLLVHDSHSNRDAGFAAAEALMDQDIVTLIGPQEEDLAFEVAGIAAANRIVNVSGSATSPRFSTLPDDGYFFRTSPSVLIYGQSLAGRMRSLGVKSAVVLTTADEYGFGFANVVQRELGVAGIATPLPPIPFEPGAPTYGNLLRMITDSNADAIALAGYPRTSAQIVQEWAILGGDERWFLAPTLREDAFLNNVPPNALDGIVGVSPRVAGDAAVFAEDFQSRWPGTPAPSQLAYFYYDAMALVGLAMASASVEAGGVPDSETIRDHMRTVSRQPGDYVAWYELERGIALLREGHDIDYRGASGSVDLDARGDIETPGDDPENQVEFWTIHDDRFVVE